MKKKVKYLNFLIFFGFLLFSIVTYASEDIFNLLKEYEKAEAEKTKNETLGKVFVFTRRDLDILQINTLADLLRNIPIGYVSPNAFGVNQFVYSRLSPLGIVYAIRVYFDGHELSSIHTNSPFLTYDNFPLDNIEKAEVYISFSPSELSAENGLLIVKLYSKDPSKENAKVLKGIFDSRKSYSLSYSDAEQLSLETKYFLLVNTGELKFSKPYVKNNKLNRNQSRKHFYFKFNYIDTTVQLSLSDVKRGIWGGFSNDFSPDFGKMRSTDVFLVLSQKLLNDKSLKLLVSYDRQFRNYIEANLDYGLAYSPYILKYGYPVYINEDRIFTKYTFNMEKIFKKKDKNLKLNLIYSDYQQTVNLNKGIYKSGKTIIDYEPDYEEYMNFYSVVAAYSQKLKDNLKLSLEGKLSYFDMEDNGNFSTFDKKVGFIYHRGIHFFKILVSQININPSLILMESAKNKLKPMKNSYILFEDRINLKSYGKVSLVLSYARIKNLLRPTKSGVINDSNIYHGRLYYLDYTKDFDLFNFSIEGWINDVDIPEFSPKRGLNVKLYGEKENLDYFISLLYRAPYKVFGISVKDTYDLSLGTGYTFENGFSLKLKAENILNRSMKIVYYRPFAKGTYTSIDRRFLITLEKVF